MQVGGEVGHALGIGADQSGHLTARCGELRRRGGEAAGESREETREEAPGEDLIEQDLRSLFNIEDDAEGSMLDNTEMDDLALMFKLRKELGDDDFAAIFEDPRIKGPNL